MHKTRVFFVVISPLNLTAFGAFGIARIAHIGRVALITQKRHADFNAGVFKGVVRTKERQRMINWHHRQIFASHFRNQPAPKAGTDNNMIGMDRAAFGLNTDDAAIFGDQIKGRCVGKHLKFAGGSSLINQFARNSLGAWCHKTSIGVPQRTLNLIFFKQREFFLGLGRTDDFDIGAKSLAGINAAFEFCHAFVIANTRDFDAADARVMTHLFVEIHGIHGSPTRQKIVARRKAEVRCVRRGANVSWYAGLIDTYNIVPPVLDQVMGDRSPHDTAEADDDDVSLLWKCGHFFHSLFSRRLSLVGMGQYVGTRLTGSRYSFGL